MLDTFVSSSDVCWDIGANSGTYTLALAKLAREVIAFEPVPHNERILRRVKDLARLTNVQIETCTLSDRSGPARMLVPTEGFYGGYYMASLDNTGSVVVRTTTVDGLIADGVTEPDFIKCDAEGAEAQIVNGARGLIPRGGSRRAGRIAAEYDHSPLVPHTCTHSAARCGTEKRQRSATCFTSRRTPNA